MSSQENEAKPFEGTLSAHATLREREPQDWLEASLATIGDAVKQRRRAEEALRASEERFRAIFDQAIVGIGIASLERRLVDANPRFCEILGYSLQELRQLTFTQVTHPDDFAITQEKSKQLLAGEIPQYTLEKRYLRKDGTPVWSHTRVTLLRDAAGKPHQFLGIIEDISARRQAQELRNRLAAVVESSDDAIMTKTPEGIITSWNRGAERTFGYTAEEILGKPVTLLVPADRIDEEAAILARARRGERTEHYETVRVRKDGTAIDVSITISPLASPDGAIIGASSIIRDITQQKRAQRALAEQARVLEEIDRRKDEFLATLAHELRNPLAPIRQAALISMSPGATEAQKRWSHDVINRQVQHMSLLLDDLLDISRITRGTLVLRTQMTELNTIVDAAVETARPAIDAKRHRFLIDLPQEAVHFAADPLRLAQVLSNLLTNAARYTDPDGTIELLARCEDEDLVISVRDTGIGFTPEAAMHLFKMFSRVNSGPEHSEDGLGIGLALARGLVELHGGTLTASSAGPGQGSEFTVRLPIRATSESCKPEQSQPVPASRTSLRVLVADDNRDAAESLAILLQMEGHEVHVVHDGRAAMDAFAPLQPQVAILDIGMPGLNGYEIARRVRQGPLGRAITLIAVTGWGQDADKARALDAGFNHHFTKPIDPERLTDLLRGLSLQNRR